jgi:DNA-directed RNA polymerase specialized sigma subunit
VTVGVINAIWNYDKTNIKFLTYVHNAVFNRMMGVSNHTRSLSHLQDCDIKLLGAYVKKRQALATTGPISFDDVVTALGLKPEQIFRLRKALQSASPESCIRTGTKAIDENGGILQTAVAHEIKPYVHTTDDESKEPAAKPVISAELRELLDKVELSPWERAVLDGYLTGGAGWRTHVANSNINPKTGKPYSRMYPILTMNKIINNLKKAHAA